MACSITGATTGCVAWLTVFADAFCRHDVQTFPQLSDGVVMQVIRLSQSLSECDSELVDTNPPADVLDCDQSTYGVSRGGVTSRVMSIEAVNGNTSLGINGSTCPFVFYIPYDGCPSTDAAVECSDAEFVAEVQCR